MVLNNSGASIGCVAGLCPRAYHVAVANNPASGYQPRAKASPMTDEDQAVVEVLLCASDLARTGADFALTAAVEALGLQYTLTAIIAAYEVRDVGKLYGEAMSADAYLEAAYRIIARDSRF